MNNEEKIKIGSINDGDEEKSASNKNLQATLLQKPQLKDQILVRTISFGVNSLFLATHIALNGKFLSMLGGEGPAAGALATTYQSVILGTCVGILLSTGLKIGPQIGNKKYKEAGNIIKISWLMTTGLGILSSSVMISTRFFFPLLFEKQTAKIALDFFTGYAPIGIPFLLLITNPQIAFQAGDWYIPPLATFLFLTSATALDYYFAFKKNLGALGIGIGGTIAATGISLLLQGWFLKKNYKEYELYKCSIFKFRETIKDLFSTGWKLALQRLSEWGNLMLLATVIGVTNNKSLNASQPSIQYIGLLASTIQGVAQATAMIISKNKGIIKTSLVEKKTDNAKLLHKKNIRTIIVNNVAVALIEGVIAVSFYFARAPLSRFFLDTNTSLETEMLAEKLLWINMIGLIPDAIRIVSAGALRSWDDILFPTLISILTMTIIAIPAGWGLDHYLQGDSEFIFWMRDIALLVASVIIMDRCRRKLSADYEEIEISSLEENEPFLNHEDTKKEKNKVQTLFFSEEINPKEFDDTSVSSQKNLWGKQSNKEEEPEINASKIEEYQERKSKCVIN